MLDWTNIDTALLDMDGVLLDLHFDARFWQKTLPERYAVVHGISRAEAHKRLTAMYREQLGTLNWYDVDYWTRRLRFDVTAIKVRHANRVRVLPGVEGFLDALERRGCRRVLLTNAHPKSLRLKMAVSGLEARLDAIISSFELGHGKEHPPLWPALRQRLGFDPARTLLVEDSAANLAAARAYGIAYLVHIHAPDSRRKPVPHPDYLSVASLSDLIMEPSPAPPPGTRTGSEYTAPTPTVPPR